MIHNGSELNRSAIVFEFPVQVNTLLSNAMVHNGEFLWSVCCCQKKEVLFTGCNPGIYGTHRFDA